LKLAGTLATVLVVAYWVTMNALVIQRERELRTQGRYRAGVDRYLGTDLLRERWLEIYRKNRKIGYSGYTFEKVFAEEGVEIQTSLESRVDLDVRGLQLPVRLSGTLVLDREMKPIRLRLDVVLAERLPVTLLGERRGEDFRLEARQGSQTVFALSLPREELILADGLAPSLPYSGFRVGERFQVPCFDPVAMGRSVVDVEVVSKDVDVIDGLQTEVFHLETTFRGTKSESVVTASGELLRQKLGPPLDDIVLRRATRANAKRFFER